MTRQICYDINEIAIHNQAQLIEQRQAEQAYKRLMTSLSHDVKTPLASLVGYLEAVESNIVSGDEKDEYIRIAMEKSHHLKDFVEALFEWVKIDAGEQALHFEHYDLNECSRNIAADWIDVFERNQFSYGIDIPETAYPVRIDLNAYTRILNNLFQNVIMHSEGNQLLFKIAEDDRAAVITIRDNGKGISAADIPHVFERMYQGDHSRFAAGNGLGLSIAKELLAFHKGTIRVDCTHHAGTTLILTLPKAL